MTEEKEFQLSVDSNIMETIQHYNRATEIFAKYGLPCVGCAAASFEKISDVAAEFGVDEKVLIKEIKESESDEKENK